MERLTNADIKWIRSLHEKSGRKSEGCFIVEGNKLVDEACLSPNLNIKFIVGKEDSYNNDIPFKAASPTQMERISALKNAPAVLAVIEIPNNKFKIGKKVLCLDHIQDPGNLGTMIRIADWFGIDQIIASENTADIWNPKVVQATMGSVFRVNVHYQSLPSFLEKCKLPIYGAVMNGPSIDSVALPESAVLVIGNEGQGISDEVNRLISHPISIPRFGSAESLNAAVAAGILMAKWNRL